MKIRTRYAPSPTGRMHVGNLRTALYAYLIARHAEGDFLLRIEDTDRERQVEGAVDIIYRTMQEAGLTHDEGPDIGGAYGPYVQSERMAAGIYLKDLGQKTRPCEVEQTGKFTFRIVLTQGLNRQIRRMCKAVGYEVTQLRRVRVVNITLGNLKPGEYRELTEEERRELYRICAGSAEGKAAREAGRMPE